MVTLGLHLAYSSAFKNEQAGVAKVDKLCTKVAFKNVYVSGALEGNLLPTCK